MDMTSSRRKASRSSSTAPKFEDRVRFNWGYHDGIAEQARGSVRDMSGHFDSVYAEGYVAGVRGGWGLDSTSEPAWEARQAALGVQA